MRTKTKKVMTDKEVLNTFPKEQLLAAELVLQLTDALQVAQVLLNIYCDKKAKKK